MTGTNMQELDESLPIFKVERVQLQFSISSDFVAAQVANNVLILALSTGRILRIDLDSPSDIDGENCPQDIFALLTLLKRHRLAQEDLRDWSDSSHVPRSVSVPSDNHYKPG